MMFHKIAHGVLAAIAAFAALDVVAQDFAFTSFQSGTAQIGVFAAGKSQIIKTGLAYAEAPAWTPDAARLFFQGRKTRDAAPDIYSVSLSSGDVVRLATSKARDESPTVSPDGKTLAFMSTRGELNTDSFMASYDVYLMDIAGGAVHRFTKVISQTEAPAWSPDGQFLAFSAPSEPRSPFWTSKEPAKLKPDSAFTDIYVAKRDGSGIRKITSSNGICFHPSWSPDGKRLAFASNMHGDPQKLDDVQIYAIDLDGKNLQQLTHQDSQNLNPQWSPSGRQIIFYAASGSQTLANTAEIFIVDLHTGTVEPVKKVGQHAYFPAWKPVKKE